MGRRAAAVVTAVLLSSTVGCTASVRVAAHFHPTYRPVVCPDDVEVQIVVKHSCGELTVLENRDTPNGAKLHLFVVTYYPAAGRTQAEPVVVVGDDLGGTPEYGGHQPLTQRVRRVTYALDARGTGHAQPSLACPEVDAASRAALATSGDRGQQAFVAAVGACRARLTRLGIDPSDFSLDAMAADVEDLRNALEIKTWNVASYGSTSRIAIEVLRRYGRHVRAAWLDTPQLQTPDEASYLRAGAPAAVHAVVDACRVNRSCHRRYGDVRAAWQHALDRLGRHPAAAKAAGRPTVTIDAGRFVRGVVSLLGNGGAWDEVPMTISRAGHGRLAAVAAALTNDGAYCAGYQAACNHTVSWGSYLSVLCSDELPLDGRFRQTVSNTWPGVAAAYARIPYTPACARWHVARAATRIAAPLKTSTPILVIAGRFDPYASPAVLNQQVRTLLPGAFLVEISDASHNVLGRNECAIHLRNVWINAPRDPPAATACVSSQQIFFP